MPFGAKTLYRLVFFVPVEHAEEVKAAIFSAGAGNYGHYDHCCWESLGTGQFRPKAGSHPTIGQTGELSRLPELRIETICPQEKGTKVLEALIAAHPYEEPAYAMDRIYTLADFPSLTE